MRFLIYALSLITTLPLLGMTLSTSFHATPATASVYLISGENKDFGTYTGQLEIRSIGDKTQVTRVITYDHYRFEDLRVQEVWQADGLLNDNQVRAEFTLKRADLFYQVDAVKHSKDFFQTPAKILYVADLKNGTVRISDEKIQEKLFDRGQLASETALWKNERKFLPSKGDSHPLLGKAAMATIFAPAVRAYQNDPFVRQYSSRPEVQSQFQYFIFDPTDFQFLRKNPDVVRVNNKVVDLVSLVEASMRHDAYAPTLAQKAQSFDRDMEAYHLNELGLFARATVAADGKLLGYTSNGDGCLWSGMYAGSQAMRWLVTQEPQALENFKTSLKGLILLLDVTGSKTEFARTAEPMIPGEKLAPPWRQATAPYQAIKYVEGGNNDMVKGIFYAFAWAYQILPITDPLLAEVSAHARGLPNLRVSSEFQRVGNQFLSKGLAAIASGGRNQHRAFLASFQFAIQPTDALSINSGFYYGGIADWSGINLSMVSQVAQILVAENLLRRTTNPDFANQDRKILKHVRENLIQTWSTYATARRGFLTIAANTFSIGKTLNLSGDTAAQHWPQQEKWAEDLSQAIWLLREVPLIRHEHSISFDFSLKPEWSVSAWPLRPWKHWDATESNDRYFQGAYNFPIFESTATESDNYWKSAFDFRGGSAAGNRNGRIDYLNVYWMARLSGLLDDAS